MRSTRLFVAFVLLTVAASAQQPDTIRVCTWNLLNYSPSVDSQRNSALRTVTKAIVPDIMVTQEVEATFAAAYFWTSVLGAGGGLYDAATFTDGPDSDNALYFNSIKLELLGAIRRGTELREIDGWILRVRSTGDTIRIYSAHLKAGDTQADREQRQREATILRQHLDSLPLTSNHIVAGDLNVYNSNEPAYETLTIVGIIAAGEVFDPINRSGAWHNNEEFADIHTQSPRTRQFGGGANGGLDDRFDQILLSAHLLRFYQSGSYTAFGNDGNHFNDSINAMPNTAVSQEIAQALHDASDHLPVYLDLVFSGTSGVEEEPVWLKDMDLTEKR